MVSQQNRVTEGKAGEAGRPEFHSLRTTGHGREQSNSLQSRLGCQAVSGPDRIEDSGLLRLDTEVQHLLDRRDAQHHASIGQSQPEAHFLGHISSLLLKMADGTISTEVPARWKFRFFC